MNLKNSSRYLILMIILLVLSSCRKVADPYGTVFNVSYDQLKQEFLSPPDDAGIRAYWWWLNSNVTKDCITKDLEAMKTNGYGGAIIFDAGSSNYRVAHKTEAGPAFLSEEWLELFAHAVKEADRLGLELSINVQSGWNPGGPSVTPENAMKKIVVSDTLVSGPGKFDHALPDPVFRNLIKDVKVLAVKSLTDSISQASQIKHFGIKSLNQGIGWKGIYPLHLLRETQEGSEMALSGEDVIDITEYFSDGKLRWDIPAGNWNILRFVMTNTGAMVSTASDGWGGLSLDHLNKNALKQFDDDVISKLIQTAKAAGNSLKFIHTDSWEMGVANWTDDFIEKFRMIHGYDMTPYLPVLSNRIVGSRDISNRFLHDFRRTVADLVAGEFYKPFSEIAYENSMFTHPESGGPHSAPIDAVQNMKYNDVPMGEFWVRSNTHRVADAERLAVKQSASAAHIYGKRFIAAEGPTSIGPQWERPPKDCKNVIDRIFCSGVNRIVWHTFTASPDEYGEPGNSYFAGTHLNRHVTWWNEAKAFIEYMNRASSMLSQGLFKADALYYYGDDSPNFVFLKEEVTDLGRGYDWDKCSYDILLEKVKIKDGRITLPDGMSYSILVLPNENAIKAELLVKLQALVKQGMVLVGPKPEKATGLRNYPDSDNLVKSVADEMWGGIDGKNVTMNNYGKGKVYWGITPGDVLQSLNIQPDFDFKSNYPDTHLDYIHRYTASEEIYFVVNRLARHGINDTQYRYLTDLPDRYEEVVCKFRVTGKVPELWNPMTGEIREIAVYYEDNGFTHVPLHFKPEGSLFIVFRDSKQNKHIQKIVKDGVNVFPELNLPVSGFPSFKIYRENSVVTSEVLHPGDWKLHWSDGSVTDFSENEPKYSRSIDSPWFVTFDKHWGPQEKLTMDSLKSWSDSPDERIKYYSGSADYSNSFSLSSVDTKDKTVYLDLGNVQEIASVKINGEDAGIAWIAPFVQDITPYVKEGQNNVVITVTNSWVNRLIGDSYLPVEKRHTRTNVVKFEGDDKETYIRKSGLTGDVKLVISKRKEIN
jgi:hypothetical protein